MRIHKKLTAISILFLPLVITQGLFAQTVISGGRIVQISGSSIPAELIQSDEVLVQPNVSSSSTSTSATNAETPEQLRLQKMLQLQFDRRGTVYLQQWSKANLPEPTENDNAKSSDAADKTSKWTPSDLPPSPIVKPVKLTPEQIKAIENEVAKFEQAVILGDWAKVKLVFASLPIEDGKKVYQHLLTRLSTSSNPVQVSGELTPEQQMAIQIQQQAQSAGIKESIILNVEDVVGLIECAPEEIEDDHQASLGRVLALVKSRGYEFDGFVNLLENGIGQFGGQDLQARQRAAKLLLDAQLYEHAASFLPPLDAALAAKAIDVVKLHLSFFEQTYAKQRKPELLEKSWGLIQFLLSQESLEVSDRESLLRKAVDYAGKIREELGEKWLQESFTEQPDRGLQIVANLGATVSQNFVTRYQSPSSRIESLKLQNNAVEALLEVAPGLAEKWQPALNVLVENWIQEAETAVKYYYDYTSRPRMQLDIYGNYYWASPDQQQQMYSGNSRRPRPIPPHELLQLKPGANWQAIIFDAQQNKFNSVLAQLYLKNQQEEEAFPYIEQVCKREPKQGRSLVNEFMQAWTRAHDPNSNQRNRNPYIYVYGYDMKADAIPLTRSKQERNLKELQSWIERIRALPIEPIDDKVLAKAFTTCHSQAEVFKLEAFENVFGSLDSLKPATIASIGHTMRVNLAGKWRNVQLQEAANTKRKAPEIEFEVVEGYSTALNIIDQSLSKNPENWQLMLAKACLVFENNAYQSSLQDSSDFTEIRNQAFVLFKNASDLYRKTVIGLEENEHSVEVYQYWFYASLGACEVRQITHETAPDTKQHAIIRAALASLPGELAEKHMAKFANDLFTRMSPLKPQVKFRYLEGGFTIVGDHPRAEEARKVYRYYQDLVTEIKLEIKIDGSERVGNQQPFGVFVNLVHTPEIERESGGFAKYVQNQNQNNYAYNYGRPTEDYRDKFEEATSKALVEHFEVLSVIFEDPKSMKSRRLKSHWRITPYAYVLLKPKGPEVDKIPSLTLDLDFLDTSGYAVIPIQSQSIPISCSIGSVEARPVSDVEIVQTLDERRASEGKLILEVKATATGIVPDLDALLDLKIDGFDVVSIDDQPVVPTKFDDTTNDIQIKSDRSWSIEMAASEEKSAEQFMFPAAKLVDAKNTFQRYDDADLVEVSNTVELEENYAQVQSWWITFLPLLIGIPVVLVVAAAVIMLIARRPQVAKPFEMPEEVNPFTVIGLLKKIDQHGNIGNRDRPKLQESIVQLERHYFSQSNGDSAPDLEKLAASWIRKA